MFGVLRKLFGRSNADEAAPTGPRLRVVSSSSSKNSGARGQAPSEEGQPSEYGDAIIIPFTSIIKLVPQELWGKTAPAGCSGRSFPIERQEAVVQLAQGSVKVTFGSLRLSAPAGLFIETAAHDQKLVDLPLSEIIPQLQPEILARRPNQRRVDVPEEVGDLFGPKGEKAPNLRIVPKGPMPKGPTAVTAPPPLPDRVSPAPAPASAPVAPATPIPFPKPGRQPAKPTGRSATSTSGSASAPAPSLSNVATAGGRFFEVALQDLADAWPDPIRQEIAQLKVSNPKVALPLDEVGEALKQGHVEYSWNQLRAWVRPAHEFTTPSPFGHVILELPAQVLTPHYLDKTHGTSFFKKSTYHDTRPEALARPPTESPGPLTPAPTPPAAPAPTPPAPAPSSGSAATPIPAPKIPRPATLKPKGTEAETKPRTPIAVRTTGARPLPTATAPAPVAEAPKPVLSPTAPPATSGAVVIAPLRAVIEKCSDEVRQELEGETLAKAEIHIPLEILETDLKTGRLAYEWVQVLEWVQPPVDTGSPNGESCVELALRTVAPLFLKARPVAAPRKPAKNYDIPDLFAAKEAAPAASEGAAPAAGSPPPSTPEPPAPKRAPKNLGELFGQPEKASWTPAEMVKHCASLPNLAGALIALQDGLLVASSMPKFDSTTDTMAAFLPQIFGRMNQYCRELKIGDVQMMSFTVERGTLVIFRAGLIYLCALVQPGQPTPMLELNLVAVELSRHTK